MNYTPEGYTAFQHEFLRNLGFSPEEKKDCTCWHSPAHPERGSVLLYRRPELYTLTVADYTVSKEFSLPFISGNDQLRFGNFYDGQTHFHIEGIAARSTTPTSFLVRESRLHGRQFWNAGQHFRGVEFTVFPDYLKQLEAVDESTLALSRLPFNCSYHFLPPTVSAAMRQLARRAENGQLRLLSVESTLLQCIEDLCSALDAGAYKNHQIPVPTVRLGNHLLTFNSADLSSLQKARQILMDQPENPPTIAQLSKLVFLNEQKLKAGFPLIYHMTIGAFVREQRMSRAAALLTSSSLSVHEIAMKTGYASSSSFIKVFRETYQKTPLAFRKDQRAALETETGAWAAH